jgi:hypothetical protein
MADPDKPDEEKPEDPSIGDRARAVATGTGAAAGAIARKLRDNLRGTKSSPDPNVPATLRRLGKDRPGSRRLRPPPRRREGLRGRGRSQDRDRSGPRQTCRRPAGRALPNDG